MNNIIGKALSASEKRKEAGCLKIRAFDVWNPQNRQERRKAAKVKREMTKAERQA